MVQFAGGDDGQLNGGECMAATTVKLGGVRKMGLARAVCT